MNTKQLGDIGVAAAILHYSQQERTVLVPMGDSARYDLAVDIDGSLKRVQCKTTTHRTPHGVPVVGLSTQGGNRSWEGKKKMITPDECDIVFVHVLGGASYEFPVEMVSGKASLNLGTLQEAYRITP